MAEPAAIGRGRVVDKAGKPCAGVGVNYATAPGRDDAADFWVGGQAVVTDDQGRFVARGLLPGGRIRLFASHRDIGSSPRLEFSVKDTNPIDLGDIVLHRR